MKTRHDGDTSETVSNGKYKIMSTRKHKNDRFNAVHGKDPADKTGSKFLTRKQVAKQRKAKRVLKPKKICTKPEVISRRNKKMEIRKERMTKYHIRKAEELKKKQDAGN